MKNQLLSCFGAVDCITITIEITYKIYNPTSIYCSKRYYDISVQGLINTDYMFAAISPLFSGATNVSSALQISNIGKFLEEVNLVISCWIAGDQSCSSLENVLTPFQQSFLIPYTESFNFSVIPLPTGREGILHVG